MSEKLPRHYQLNEMDPGGSTLVRSEWPLQIWRTEAGNYTVWLYTDEWEGLHCRRNELEAAMALFCAVRDMLR